MNNRRDKRKYEVMVMERVCVRGAVVLVRQEERQWGCDESERGGGE